MSAPENLQYNPNQAEYPERDIITAKTYAPTATLKETLLNEPEVKIDFSEGRNPFGTPFDNDHPEILRVVMEKAWAEQSHYPDPKRIQKIQEKLKERAGLENAEVYIFGGGSDRGLSDIITRDIDDEAMVIGIGPHFTGARTLAVQRGNPEGYKAIQPPSLTLSEGLEMLKRDPDFLRGGALVYASPGTPTGDIFSPSEIQDLVEHARFHKNLVVLDNAFGSGLERDETGISLLDSHENLIVLGTLSKDIGLPGAGVGIGYFSPERAKQFGKLLLPYPVRGSSLVVAEEILLTDRLDTFLAQNTPKIIAAKSELLGMLQDEGIRYEKTDLRTLPLVIEGSNDHFQRDLLEKFGIKTAGGEGFDPTHGELSNRYIRVTVQDSANNRELVQAVAAIRDEQLELDTNVKIRIISPEVPLVAQVHDEQISVSEDV